MGEEWARTVADIVSGLLSRLCRKRRGRSYRRFLERDRERRRNDTSNRG